MRLKGKEKEASAKTLQLNLIIFYLNKKKAWNNNYFNSNRLYNNK